MASLAGVLAESRRRGLLGPGAADEHTQRARVFADAVAVAPTTALDLGAGGGLPGMVLAVEYWPETTWCFLDASKRRTDFLQEAVEDLGLQDRIRVVQARAEDFGRDPAERASYDLVVARSFGPPAVVAECGAPLLRPGGRLVVSEPPAASLPDRWPVEGLASLGLAPPVAVVGTGPVPTHLVWMERSSTPVDRYPRRVGIPTKRPLF